MKIKLNLKDYTVKVGDQPTMTIEEAGIVLDDCESSQDIEEQVSDWANDRGIEFAELETIFGQIFFPKRIWYNDALEKRSILVNAADVGEICGSFLGRYNSLGQLNDDLYGFSFSEEPEF